VNPRRRERIEKNQKIRKEGDERMRLLKPALAALGSLVVVAIVMALVAPKAVHAVVAAAVEVMNTSANPAATYDSGGTRFQADVCYTNGPVSVASGYCGGVNSATFVVPTLTAAGATVKRLLVDNVSGFCSSFNDPGVVIKTVTLAGQFVPDAVPNGMATAGHYIPIVGPGYTYVNNPGGPPLGGVPETDYTFGQVTHFAFNPGDTVTLAFQYFFPGGAADGICSARVEGTLATE
jgi:hypothetical protein